MTTDKFRQFEVDGAGDPDPYRANRRAAQGTAARLPDGSGTSSR